MKALIFSDSHGTAYYMERALRMHPECEVVFFLGDGLRDIDNLDGQNRCWLPVRGNNDYTSVTRGISVEKTETVTLEGVRITYTHGDIVGAKYGSDGVIRLAEETNADVVLFGHTHSPFEKFLRVGGRGVYLFNPGAIGTTGNRVPSYGLLDITEKGIIFSHASFEF